MKETFVLFGNSGVLDLLRVKQRWFFLIVAGIFAAAIIMSSLGSAREAPVPVQHNEETQVSEVYTPER